VSVLSSATWLSALSISCRSGVAPHPVPGIGAALRQVSLPSFDAGLPAYYVIALSEASSNLSRYDGVRYGQRAQAEGEARQCPRLRAQYVLWLLRESRPACCCPMLGSTPRQQVNPGVTLMHAELRGMYGKTRQGGLGSEVGGH
jgi:Asp-tRNA(Asn)/Glu-tRNA(Gln) amidotransferase A subunit family amidase